MNMNRIAQHVRQAIGKLLPVNPEKERIVSVLLERLKDHDAWIKENFMTIKHKEDNIQVDYKRVEKPDFVWIPFRWRSHVKEHVDIVLHKHEVDRLGFIHDVINRKYVYQVHVDKSEYEEWLAEHVKSDEYIIKNFWIYFLNEETAMGFKLAMM